MTSDWIGFATGVAGCYHIGKHYEYEAWRGVQHLSSMTRAIGGRSQFAQQSPCVILEHCAQQLGVATAVQHDRCETLLTMQ